MEKTGKASLCFVLLLTAYLIGTEGGRVVLEKDEVNDDQKSWVLGRGWPFGGWPFWFPWFLIPGWGSGSGPFPGFPGPGGGSVPGFPGPGGGSIPGFPGPGGGPGGGAGTGGPKGGGAVPYDEVGTEGVSP